MSLDTDDLKIIPTIGMTPYRARIVEAGNDRVRQRLAAQRERDRETRRRADAETAATLARIAAERDATKRMEAAVRAEGKKPRNWHPATLILHEVGAKHGFTVADLKSVWREKPVVRARQEAMWRIRTECGLSFPDIGRRLGGRDHTTILHGIAAHGRRMAEGGEA